MPNRYLILQNALKPFQSTPVGLIENELGRTVFARRCLDLAQVEIDHGLIGH